MCKFNQNRISIGQFLRGSPSQSICSPPSKRPLGPSGATGLRVFRRAVASLKSPATLSGVASTHPSVRPSSQHSFGTKRLLCSVNIPKRFFRATFWTPWQPSWSSLESNPAAFKGHSRLKWRTAEHLKHRLLWGSKGGMTKVTLIPSWTPFFTHPKHTSLLLWFGDFCSDSGWRFWGIPGGGDTPKAAASACKCSE